MKRLNFFRLLVIVSLGFALTLSSNIQEPALMTHKVLRLAPGLPNTALGFLGFVGLVVAMLVQPIVGVFSDRARGLWGRRLPFMLLGALMIAGSLYVLALAPALWVLVLGILLIQMSSNILQGPWQALIPDLVPEHQRGTASGLKAVMDILAFVVGRGVAGFFFGRVPEWGEAAVLMAVSVPIAIFGLGLIVTAIWARERPEAAAETVTTESIGAALRKAFSVDWRAHPTFRWWFFNRMLFWGAFIFLNTFLVTYMIGVLKMAEADAQKFVGSLSTIIGGTLLLMALPAGLLADKFGRKPLVMASGVVAFAGTVTLLLARDTTTIIIGGAVIGLSIGAFLSANWAMITDIVPRPEAARYLGIANIATCLGSGGARLLGAFLIDPLNKAFDSTSVGFLTVYGLAALCFLASTLAILPLRQAAPKLTTAP
ncbi:MAG: MFS transporter [Anaerolineales bacterium]|nr:MFS transporter [Anaerolineales bacterium]